MIGSSHAQKVKSYFVHKDSAYIVVFENQSSNINSNTQCYWNFGDGSYSSLFSPSHAYTNIGKYAVALYITDGINSDIYIDTIETNATGPACKAFFNYNISNENVQFNSLCSGVDSNTIYEWTFGTKVKVYDPNPFKSYTKGGIKTVKLKINNAFCTDSFETSIYIQPKKYISAKFSTYKIKDTVYFYETLFNQNTIHYWTFGDNSTSTQFNPVHIYKKNGTYQVCLLVNDTSTGFKEVYCDSIVLTDIPCAKADFNYTIDSNLVVFNNLSNPSMPNSYWLFGDGKESSFENPSHLYNSPGNYLVELFIYDSNSTCFQSVKKNINIASFKELFSISGKVMCNNKPVDEAIVLLIYTDSETHVVSNIDSLYLHPLDNGKYYFNNVRKGYYTIKSYVNNKSIYIGQHYPIYITGETLWENIKPIYINFNFEDADFKLPKVSEDAPTGILEGSTYTKMDSLPPNTFEILKYKNLILFKDNIVVGSNLSNSMGKFNISLKGTGVYHLYMDIPGKKNYPLQFEMIEPNLFFNSCIMYENETSTFPELNFNLNNNNISSNQTRVYPIPTSSKLTVEHSKPLTIIYIYDIHGKLVLTKNLYPMLNSNIDVQSLSAGMYILLLKDESGETFINKFIKN
jgi:PKD repeat protein